MSFDYITPVIIFAQKDNNRHYYGKRIKEYEIHYSIDIETNKAQQKKL